jgi:4-amino-4-deoxy-L-arabinose transferase-like glycosyltransferase
LTLGGRFVKTRIVRTESNLQRGLAIAIGVIAIAVRFIDINQPFIDEWSWRQSDVAAIARNYLHNGFHFAYPQIDWAGDQPGYVGTEFPILPYTVAICYKIAGVHEWIGRSQSVIFFAASLPFFFLLVRQIFGVTAATWALFFYSFAPLNLMASRCFMPDVPSLSLAIIGLYFFLRWIDSDETKLLFVSAVLISLSVLIKLPSVLICAPIAYVTVAAVCDRRSILWKKCDGGRPPLQRLVFFATIVFFPSALWYWHAHEIAEKFYPHHLFGAGGIRLMRANWYWKIARETLTCSLTPLLAALAGFGFFVARPARRARLFYAWLAAMLLFAIVVGYGNRHPWYRLPLIPIASAFAGAACTWISERFAPKQMVLRTGAIALIVLFGGLSYNYAKPFYHESAADLRSLGLELNRTMPAKSLIVAADYGDPTVFYYAERKGWHFLERDGVYNGHPTSSSDAIADLEALRRKGATHLVFYPGTLWWLDYYKEFAQHLNKTARLMRKTSEFEILQLNSPKE